MDFGEELHKMFLAGVGALAMTGEKARELITELVQRGELTVAQGKVLNEELQHKIHQKVQTVTERKPSAERMNQYVEKMSAEERAALKRKLEELDRADTDDGEEA